MRVVASGQNVLVLDKRVSALSKPFKVEELVIILTTYIKNIPYSLPKESFVMVLCMASLKCRRVIQNRKTYKGH